MRLSETLGARLRRSSAFHSSASLALLASGSLLAPGVLAGCGGRAGGGDSPVSDQASPPRSQRSREGRASRLEEMAREAGVSLPGAADAGASREGPGTLPPFDAADAGASGAPLDAGALPVEGDAAAPLPLPPPPPEPLPRDIVAQSALPIYGLEAGVVLSESELWDRLAENPAVCFGEFHDVPAHHYAETRAIDELAARAALGGFTFAIGYEMFQRPYQAPLSAYVAGELEEEAFLAQTEYVTRWGWDYALYRPLLEGTRAQGVPALALNARAELTRKIGRTGLESLDEAELAELPELVLDDAEHREFIFGLFGVLPDHAAESGLENVYAAQTTWDETMAETSARWLSETGESARLLDFAGGAHCHRSAIPRRLTRRTAEPALSVHAVFASELADGTFTPEGYDLLVVLDDVE